jgi:DNA polymerase V
MKAIVDCNSFYCSCERLFRPDIAHKPVVVLSNNDGCIISRTDEAKKLGVEMAGPYFKAKPLIEQFGVAAFSSNYNLYGDLSMRVMDTLRVLVGAGRVEVYSVDEAFLDLDMIPTHQLQQAASEIREVVERWTGISVSIGVAPTKVLSKVANKIAKQHKKQLNNVMVLDTPEKIREALQKTEVDDLWGVGRQYAVKLREFWGIHTALQLSNMNEEWARKNLGGVVGLRLMKELNGVSAIGLDKELTVKKMIATTRMFGAPVTSLIDIKEAVATYTSRAAEKLRRQRGAASVISVFVVPKEFPKEGQRFRHGPSVSSYTVLPKATSITNELIKPAIQLVEKLYQQGELYKKAGVTLSGIVPENSLQANMFVPAAKNCEPRLMQMMDNINFSQRGDVLKFAASGTTRDWKMRQELRSGRYTTRWDELFEVR